jgi:hypothetical protein
MSVDPTPCHEALYDLLTAAERVIEASMWDGDALETALNALERAVENFHNIQEEKS